MDNILHKKMTKRVRYSLKQEGLTGFDMHFHTRYSMDGISRIKNVLKKANKQGIGLAITDHNRMRGVTACLNNIHKVPIIPGIEVTCEEGTHILLYFYTHDELREFYTKKLLPTYKKNQFRAGYTVYDLLELSKDYNCVNSVAHPFAPGRVGIKHIDFNHKMIKNVDNIEVFNGYNTRPMNNKALDLVAKWNKPVTAGSDGHTTSELGSVLICVNGTTVEEVLSAVKKRKVKIYGKEENILKKFVLAMDKETLFIKNSRLNKQALFLFKNQFGSEYRSIEGKVLNKRSRKLGHFRRRHLHRKVKVKN